MRTDRDTRIGGHAHTHAVPAAARMLTSGALPMDDIVTHQLPLAQFQDGLGLVADGTASIKVSLIP